MMRQVVYQGSRRFEVREVPDPVAASGQVVVRVAYTGLCGTDLHIFHGDMDARVRVPVVVGHEMSGTVETVGDDAGPWTAGQRVTVMPLQPCGRCPACRTGNSHICHHLVFLGIDADGAMQEFWRVPAHALVSVPNDVTLKSAALVEPMAVAAHDVQRAEIAAGERVLVVGGGPVGLLIAVLAKHRGADVLVVEPDPFRAAVCRDVGLPHPRSGGRSTFRSRLQDWTGGAGAAVSLRGLRLRRRTEHRCRLARHQGPTVPGGHPSQPARGEPAPVLLARAHTDRRPPVSARGLDEAVALIASGMVPADRMISSVVALDR